MPDDSNAKLHIVSAHFNLQPYHAARYDGFLKRHGNEWRLTSFLLRSTEEYRFIEQRHAAESLFEVRRLNPQAPAGRRARQAVIHQALAELKPDVLLLLGGYSEFEMHCVFKFGVERRLPIILCSDTKADDAQRSGWREWMKGRLVGFASAALVAGRPHADYMLSLGFNPAHVFQGFDVVDNDYFSAKAEESRKQKAESRNKFNLTENYFLASARFIEEKNLPRLLQAYALYRKRAESRKQKAEIWDLFLLGEGPLRPEVERLISDLRIQSSVTLSGFKQYPDLPAYYGCASVFILPSVKDTWGLAVNEAMASGLPVMVSKRCGCTPDLVQEGVNGFTFDPYDVEGMAQLMLKISAMDAGSAPAPDAVCRDLTENPFESDECVTSASHGGFVPQTSTTLAEMGATSRRIIADWGPDRFASGLKQAVDCALLVGPIKPTLMQRAVLAALLRR